MAQTTWILVPLTTLVVVAAVPVASADVDVLALAEVLLPSDPVGNSEVCLDASGNEIACIKDVTEDVLKGDEVCVPYPSAIDKLFPRTCAGSPVCRLPGVYDDEGLLVTGRGSEVGALVRTIPVDPYYAWIYVGIIVSPMMNC